ncbi:putative mitochondrial F1F0 ATP synthase subunit Atp18 [Aureobasidium melanogenum CBS 110374]|uniref:Mitochondrial F1F0 ATP synthase subunit Atp18 n=2 Tax=Aureobasidium TaxID=5579 RepID=A0ABR0TWL6_AURPU|nr:putative mitochondrial F1F0 ATP synthase subunit Atp18 [Aureobasidium melanogenum CBS 110374]KEQ66658.1 putative mitochondrial F1F0 ATP synthase subunit Atp18 [Aureobasidium melanogenum CBS 110374]
MAGLLGKKFPTPVARPMAPFYVAGAIIFYGINSLATTLANTDEYRNDPRNPNKTQIAKVAL